ncbi:hypothetical protein [Rhizobium leguminosarum]|uniref:hypothetical protein n=1 Tax=Rhizobium leguminosarum TaxID=384 RepID=UPI000E2EA262|nr:hypothetical protein [Rhizobium leguminosarum]
MIDMITIGGIHGYRHYHGPSGCRRDEEQFYAEFGDSSIIRFAGWLTSLDLTIKRLASKGRRRKHTAQPGDSCGCAPQATFLAVR